MKIGRCPECHKPIYIKDIEELDPETIIGCGLAEGNLVHCHDCPNKEESEDWCIRGEDILSTAIDEISKIERCNLKTINVLLRANIENMNEEKAQINRAIEAMTGTISEQNQILLHINAEIEFIQEHPFDSVLIAGSVENISNVIKGHKKPFINEERIECVRLKKELDAKTEIIKEMRSKIEPLLDSSASIFNRDSIIDGKIITISQLKNRIDDQENKLQSGQEEITALKTEVDRLRGIIRTEHDHNADLLEGNKSKFHKIIALESELAASKADSVVLMKVAKAVDTWHCCMIPTSLTGCTDLIKVLDDILVGYYDAPEGPPEKYKVYVENTPIDKFQGITAYFWSYYDRTK